MLEATFEIVSGNSYWGNIQGDIENQIDLQEALTQKADKIELDADVEIINQTISENFNTLDNKINSAQSELSGDISTLENTVNNNNTAVNSRIDTTNQTVAELSTTVADNNTAINNRVDGIVESFDGDVSDLETAIQNEAATRANNDTLLQGDINTLRTDLTSEISNRTSADNTLQNNIDTLATNLSDEVTARTNADTTLQGNINTLSSTVTSNYTTLDTKINNTKTAIDSDISDLSNTVNQNYTDLSNAITASASTINSRIDTEVGTLNTAITTENTQRQAADNNLQSQIDAITSASDVFDIVGTYAELEAYDISTVPPNDIIKVLVDSTHNNAATYYRCVENDGVKSWTYIGSEGAYYTKSEADNAFVAKTTTINNKPLSSNITLTASDINALPADTVIGSGVITLQKNGVNVDSFNVNATANKSINISVPTDTSDLSNGAGYITNSALNGYATENFVTSQGYITGITSSDVTTALGYTPYNSTNPNGYITNSALADYQPLLVSGTNIKTINNQSLLGSGDITIQAGGTVDQTYDPTSTNAQSGTAVAGALEAKQDLIDALTARIAALENNIDGGNA